MLTLYLILDGALVGLLVALLTVVLVCLIRQAERERARYVEGRR